MKGSGRGVEGEREKKENWHGGGGVYFCEVAKTRSAQEV